MPCNYAEPFVCEKDYQKDKKQRIFPLKQYLFGEKSISNLNLT